MRLYLADSHHAKCQSDLKLSCHWVGFHMHRMFVSHIIISNQQILLFRIGVKSYVRMHPPKIVHTYLPVFLWSDIYVFLNFFSFFYVQLFIIPGQPDGLSSWSRMHPAWDFWDIPPRTNVRSHKANWGSFEMHLTTLKLSGIIISRHCYNYILITG